jgi:large subunit ribosomal protein L9
LFQQTVQIDKSEVQLPDGPIKETGDHLITISVHPEVSAEVTVKVLAE